MAAAVPLIRASEDGKAMIHLLANLGRALADELVEELSEAKTVYRQSLDQEINRRKKLAEIEFLRRCQLRRIEQAINPVAMLKRHFLDQELICLKIAWVDEEGKNRSKTVSPFLERVLSESLFKGDTVAQILHTAEAGERFFCPTPELHQKGMIPQWVKDWEDTGYNLDFHPFDFGDWVKIRLD